METGSVNRIKKNRIRTKKQGITIMTLLANEATAPARKLLIKHGVEDATGYEDLEWKLRQLYFNTATNKAQFEEEMANMHPHKDWILRTLKKDIQAPVAKEMKPSSSADADEAHASIRKVVDEKSSGCCGGCGKSSNACGSCGSSSLDGEPQSRSFRVQDAPIGIIGIVAIVAMTFFILSKTVKEA